MGSAVSMGTMGSIKASTTLTQEQFEKLAETCGLFKDKADITHFIADNVSSWPLTRSRALELYTTQCKKNAKSVNLSTCFGTEVQRKLNELVRSILRSALDQAQPDAHLLPVVFAEVTNHMCAAMCNAAKEECNAYAKEILAFSKEQMNEFYHVRVALRTEAVVSSPTIIKPGTAWTAPQDDERFQKTKRLLNEQHVKLEQAVEAGDPAKVRTCKEKVRELADKQVHFYASYKKDVQNDEAVNCAEICLLTEELNPKYANVYRTTGDMVKGDKGQKKVTSAKMGPGKSTKGTS